MQSLPITSQRHLLIFFDVTAVAVHVADFVEGVGVALNGGAHVAVKSFFVVDGNVAPVIIAVAEIRPRPLLSFFVVGFGGLLVIFYGLSEIARDKFSAVIHRTQI